jgi:hypothetical protein
MPSTTCPSCQMALAEGATTCPGCGRSQISAAGESPVFASTPQSPDTQPKPQVKFNWGAVSQVDRLVGGGTLVLFIALFLPWFSVSLGPLGSVSASGLSAHGYLYITLFLALGVIGLLAAESLGLWNLPATSPLRREQILLGATAVNLVLVLIAFLLKPGETPTPVSAGALAPSLP